MSPEPHEARGESTLQDVRNALARRSVDQFCQDSLAPSGVTSCQGPGANLPISKHAEDIVHLVRENPVTVVIAETGSGKTTQIAQILTDGGLVEDGKLVAVTQPRRVAAVSVARRVAEERDTTVGAEVGYAVRFEEATSDRTRIKFLTDGTLLREIMSHPNLEQYSVIVLDEAHERTLNTDVLFGVLRALVTRRPSFRLVITSATLDGEKFSEFFFKCPVLRIAGREFPVEILHVAETPKQYKEAAVECALDIHCGEGPGDILVFLPGQAEIEDACRKLNTAVSNMAEGECGPLLVIPLYAALPLEVQARVFTPPPEGVRRCIVATNIAETSVTVDGVVYVVDPGVSKQKEYDPKSGMDSLSVRPISRVQATQRAGRAGRTRPGKCYRLYTEKHFKREMPEATVPEIQRTSLAGTVLYLKTLPVPVDVLRFDFLDRPDEEQLKDALRQLYALGAIDVDGAVTEVGRRMSEIPVEPSLARSLLAAKDLGCVPETLSTVAMLSAESVFVGGRGPDMGQRGSEGAGPRRGAGHATDRGREILKRLAAEREGDFVLLLRVWEVWARSGFDKGLAKDMGLDMRGMRTARDVRRQLVRMFGEAGHGEDGKGRGGAGDRGGDRRGEGAGPREGGEGYSTRTRELRHALCMGYASRVARRAPMHNGYRTMNDSAQLAQAHPNSLDLLPTTDDGLLPDWVVFSEFIQTSRPFLSTVCPVEEEWVRPILPRLREVDVARLSGGISEEKAREKNEKSEQGAAPAGGKKEGKGDPKEGAKRRLDDSAVAAAKARYEARKKARGK